MVESVATSTAFAAFATARGKNLAVHDLIDAVWRGQPTRTARQGVHVQISRMRKMIGELGYDGSAAIEKVSVGYRLDPDVAETDVDLFENHAQLGFTSQRVGARQDALAHFDDALSLWRGEPMAGLPVGPSLSHDRDVLNRLAIDVREARAEVLIQLGACREVISEIECLIGLDPYQELLHAGLMIAFSRSGRRSEALRVYRSLAHRLNKDLGIGPDPRVHNLFQAIFDGQDYTLGDVYEQSHRPLIVAS